MENKQKAKNPTNVFALLGFILTLSLVADRFAYGQIYSLLFFYNTDITFTGFCVFWKIFMSVCSVPVALLCIYGGSRAKNNFCSLLALIGFILCIEVVLFSLLTLSTTVI